MLNRPRFKPCMDRLTVLKLIDRSTWAQPACQILYTDITLHHLFTQENTMGGIPLSTLFVLMREPYMAILVQLILFHLLGLLSKNHCLRSDKCKRVGHPRYTILLTRNFSSIIVLFLCFAFILTKLKPFSVSWLTSFTHAPLGDKGAFANLHKLPFQKNVFLNNKFFLVVLTLLVSSVKSFEQVICICWRCSRHFSLCYIPFS